MVLDTIKFTPFRFVFFMVTMVIGFLIIVIKGFEVEKKHTHKRRSRAAEKIAERMQRDEEEEREERRKYR